jgi:hypothetical protein
MMGNHGMSSSMTSSGSTGLRALRISKLLSCASKYPWGVPQPTHIAVYRRPLSAPCDILPTMLRARGRLRR